MTLIDTASHGKYTARSWHRGHVVSCRCFWRSAVRILGRHFQAQLGQQKTPRHLNTVFFDSWLSAVVVRLFIHAHEVLSYPPGCWFGGKLDLKDPFGHSAGTDWVNGCSTINQLTETWNNMRGDGHYQYKTAALLLLLQGCCPHMNPTAVLQNCRHLGKHQSHIYSLFNGQCWEVKKDYSL